MESGSKIYGKKFYQNQSGGSYESAVAVLQRVFEVLPVKVERVVDFGCGLGTWLAGCRQLGVSQLIGVEGDHVKHLDKYIEDEHYIYCNLEKKRPAFEQSFDLAICLEVAEHLTKPAGSEVVKALTLSSDYILFSAAIPYQGGDGHINETWSTDWVKLFSYHNYECFDVIRPAIWDDFTIDWWYRQNVMLFVKNGSAKSTYFDDKKSFHCKNLVHPQQFLTEVHSARDQVDNSLGEDFNFYKSSACFEEGLVWKSQENYIAQKSRVRKGQAYNFDMLKDSSLPIIYKDDEVPVEDHAIDQPVLLIVGVQKAATTWLFNFLSSRDTAFYGPPVKEVNFFNRLFFARNSAYSGFWADRVVADKFKGKLNDINNDRWSKYVFNIVHNSLNLAWYKKVMTEYSRGRVAIDATPEYCMLPSKGINYLSDSLLNKNIVLVLRDPVERVISQAKAALKAAGIPVSDEDIIEFCKRDSVIKRSDYSEILNSWMHELEQGNLTILLAEKLWKSYEDACEELNKLYPDHNLSKCEWETPYNATENYGVSSLLYDEVSHLVDYQRQLKAVRAYRPDVDEFWGL
ncbi:hypothetical protein HMF8227_00731 [Saliniradius amylolyticus]|uniref:Uncharacterized protein n=1 Tax=Saliniradius amylolyticus TaxID=2183582 RepID=A0A2S2E2I5_9ALTE|nr:methyltransferase domain-containing protein [Saliniradius amylolyticus]AWL11227.1 hypothetical protein HMF8227_00731 [Saliniradius amylolyticus]